MTPNLNRKLLDLRNALPPDVRQGASFFILHILQMKGQQLPPAVCYMHLRQLRPLFPNLSEEQLAVLIVHILGEGGLLDSMSSLGETESLRLQMAMDRMSKFETTLANLLKEVWDSSTLTCNQK